ncbi:hypothetical protein OKW24_002596 [Peribacillus simplex]|jgi:hypothetical protein|nr:hypothetical protein [Peribacillus simplex]SNT23497.1 hypothetical protein SAMN05444672_11061 [Bacillus sp. OK838]
MQSNESRQQENEKRQKPPTKKAGTGNPKLSGENRPST